MSSTTKLFDWARRYFGIAVRCGISADAVYLASKQTGRLCQRVVDVSAFANILALASVTRGMGRRVCLRRALLPFCASFNCACRACLTV